MQTTISNARIVTPEEEFTGTLVVEQGRITALEEGVSDAADALDWNGDYLLAGIVDLHTDNLEKHYEPRPNVHWDPIGAAMAHDAQMAAAGVTTVLNALSVQGFRKGRDRLSKLRPILAGLKQAGELGGLRIDHKLHLRCEVSFPGLMEVLSQLLDEPDLTMLSIMDHTPGQRQYRNMTHEEMLELISAYVHTEEERQAAVEHFRNRAHDGCDVENRAAVVQQAKERGIALATHDDETAQHIELAESEGAGMAEFPVTIEAAELARAKGLSVIMGGPNLLRGGSHSGNVAVSEVAEAGLLDVLASDYLPLSMIRSAFLLTEAPFDWSVPQAIATITDQPAKAVGLADRGRIERGYRADMIRVRKPNGQWPLVRETWVEGARVA
ncbi:MAG: alpha-D-ribose 1-methylphosphonate 5-triphosphate diphosphatase [Pseudomonadota bacterium]